MRTGSAYEFGGQQGTPYAMVRAPLITPARKLCNEPPWGALTALDLTNGKETLGSPVGRVPGSEDG